MQADNSKDESEPEAKSELTSKAKPKPKAKPAPSSPSKSTSSPPEPTTKEKEKKIDSSKANVSAPSRKRKSSEEQESAKPKPRVKKAKVVQDGDNPEAGPSTVVEKDDTKEKAMQVKEESKKRKTFKSRVRVLPPTVRPDSRSNLTYELYTHTGSHRRQR